MRHFKLLSWHRRSLGILSLHRQCSSTRFRRISRNSSSVNTYDVAILGGGAMGSSSAYFLARRQPDLRICVIERDPTYSMCSTSRSVGSIRQQFSTPENIQLSQFGFKFLSEIDQHLTVDGEDPADVNLQNGGYLIIAGEKGVQTLKENHDIQRKLDCKVRLLSPVELEEIYPCINTEQISMASLGTAKEGWFDPWALLDYFKKKALALGVEYINAEVKDINLGNRMVVSDIEIAPTISTSTRENINCGTAVITSGCWSGQVAALLSIQLPIEPRKRYVYVIDCPGLVCDDAMVVSPSGVYFRREGKYFITGRCPVFEDEPSVEDLEIDYDYFDEHIWPHLAELVPAFECLKVQTAWAGFYDYNVMDQNAIVGRHPEISNLIFACGFSGHGIQHSPGIGRAVSELIIDQGYTTLDLSKLGYERVLTNELVIEKNII